MSKLSGFDFIPTGSLDLDLGLGTGGLPRGRITEIFGPESIGKTTLCLHLIAEVQKRYHKPGGNPGVLGNQVDCAFIDIDGTLKPEYARRCGVQPENLYIAEPSDAEQALGITETLARSGAMILIVVDAINTLVSRTEINTPLGGEYREPGDDLLSRTLRKLKRPIRENNTSLVFTHRTPDHYRTIYHKLSTNPARLAIKLHSAVRLKLSPLCMINNDGEIVGQQIQVEVQKNRFWPYHHTTKLDIMYNDGIESTGSLCALAVQYGVIRRTKKYYTFQGLKLGVDKNTVITKLKKDTHLRAAIEQAIRQRFLPVTF